MGIFGWDLPPGCNSVPGDEDYICEVCGSGEDNCICPECPECGDIGNLDCYRKHGHRVPTEEQRDKLAENERKWEENAATEAEADAQYFRDNRHNFLS